MDTALALPVEISEWKPAPFALGGETVFAIGDVHGCASELRVLLDTIARLATEASGKRRLIYLGDMINRGPDSVGVLELWAAGEEARGVDHVDRLMGNHEIMMLLTVIDVDSEKRGTRSKAKYAASPPAMLASAESTLSINALLRE